MKKYSTRFYVEDNTGKVLFTAMKLQASGHGKSTVLMDEKGRNIGSVESHVISQERTGFIKVEAGGKEALKFQ